MVLMRFQTRLKCFCQKEVSGQNGQVITLNAKGNRLNIGVPDEFDVAYGGATLTSSQVMKIVGLMEQLSDSLKSNTAFNIREIYRFTSVGDGLIQISFSGIRRGEEPDIPPHSLKMNVSEFENLIKALKTESDKLPD